MERNLPNNFGDGGSNVHTSSSKVGARFSADIIYLIEAAGPAGISGGPGIGEVTRLL